MKFPEDIRTLLVQRYKNKCREWLVGLLENQWPLQIKLDIPSEKDGLQQPDSIRSFIHAWQSWQGPGILIWRERRWKTLGNQRLPEKLSLRSPEEVAMWAGELYYWQQANTRYKIFLSQWPMLALQLPRYFDILAKYSDLDFQRLLKTVHWLNENPNSNLYLRQLPIEGLDSKWIEKRKKLLSELLTQLPINTSKDSDFFQRCGLKSPPYLIRLRVLDPILRQELGGLGDITASKEELAALQLRVTRVFIIENLQTGLAFSDMSGTVVFMRLGYNVDVLQHLSWIGNAKCYYWGDIDTHGFAILNRARSYLPYLQSLLMDEETLQKYKTLWVEEGDPHQAPSLPFLLDAEQTLYQGLKQQRWGHNVRLEQERIDWNYVIRTLTSLTND